MTSARRTGTLKPSGKHLNRSVRRFTQSEQQAPVLAGGLIADKEDVMAALRAGAMAISTTNQQVWLM